VLAFFLKLLILSLVSDAQDFGYPKVSFSFMWYQVMIHCAWDPMKTPQESHGFATCWSHAELRRSQAEYGNAGVQAPYLSPGFGDFEDGGYAK